MSDYRIEHDSMGEVRVEAQALWGAQTQRSYENFRIGQEKMPAELIDAFAVLKQAAANVNGRLGVLSEEKQLLIGQVCGEIRAQMLDGQFPLSVWQTGSGTQTNMNLNEVIANRGNALAGRTLLHPNDDVNRSQSSNDTFPTAIRIAAVTMLERRLLPAADRLAEELARLERENFNVIKVGRTHLQDAVPLRFSQEISGWRAMVEKSAHLIRALLPALSELALGGTAVGTGLNAPQDFDRLAAEEISRLTGLSFVTAPNKFHALTSMDALVASHGALKALAANLMKIANDIRWLASGPRCGLGELRIPENEPGSSIMPGKVNPTQCEAVTMIAVQVMGNDAAIGFAASQGNFELNVFQPVAAYNYLQSVRLLADGMDSFRMHCVSGIMANRSRMQFHLEQTLMLVTALTPCIGYDNAAQAAKKALAENRPLWETVVGMGLMSEQQAKAALNPEKML